MSTNVITFPKLIMVSSWPNQTTEPDGFNRQGQEVWTRFHTLDIQPKHGLVKDLQNGDHQILIGLIKLSLLEH